MRKSGISYLIFIFFVFVFSANAQAPAEANCFSMLAGKAATADGSVMIAHNEDDWGDLYVDWHKVPRIQHPAGATLKLENGAIIDQVAETNSFFWLQMPGMQFSDSYMNEWGLTIASNQCRSREDRASIEEGGIGYYLRRLMIEQTKTAREAIQLAGTLIENYGYHYSGRSYCVADKNEAWIMAVVKGKHWVAQRVPDDHVAIIPNYYTIGEIDLGDSLNFLGSPDIITYALERKWFDPKKGKRFNFRQAYADPSTLYGIWNIPRHLSGINQLSEKQYQYYDTFPFSFKPKQMLSHGDIMAILQSHGEGSQFEVSANFNQGNPHGTVIKRICSEGNQYSFVAQLRNELPDPIAHVMWLAPKRPCIQVFVPWYIGITEIPEAYTRGNPRTCLAKHFKEEKLKESTKEKAYWAFKAFTDACDSNYIELAPPMQEYKFLFEEEVLNNQEVFEELFTEIYTIDPKKAIDVLNIYVGGLAEKTLEFTRKNIKINGSE